LIIRLTALCRSWETAVLDPGPAGVADWPAPPCHWDIPHQLVLDGDILGASLTRATVTVTGPDRVTARHSLKLLDQTTRTEIGLTAAASVRGLELVTPCMLRR
jgi:hypothetical protein